MQLWSLIPVLDVKDVDASIDFYCTFLGFSVREQVEWGGRTEWALLQSDDVQLMLCISQEPDADDEPRSNEGVFFLYHDNLESLLKCLGAQGYTGVSDIFVSNPGARDVFLRDPDGYVLWFRQRPTQGAGQVEKLAA